MVAAVAPDQHPDLTPAERLVVTCSAYDRAPAPLLRQQLAALTPADWPSTLGQMAWHGLDGYLWYHLERLSGEWPEAIARSCQQRYYDAFKADLWQGAALEQVVTELIRAKIPIAVVKGMALHHRVYGDRPLPRGASDLDLLLFGDEEAITVAVEVIEGCGFRCAPSWQAIWARNNEIDFWRPLPDESVLRVDLHRAPSFLHVWGERNHHLLDWLGRQRAPIPWRPLTPTGPDTLPGLSSTGSLVYLAINLLKDGNPQLRGLNDVALLITREGSGVDWEAVAAIARQTGILRAIQWTLALAQTWRHVLPPAHWAARAALPPFLGVAAIVHHLAVDDGVWLGSVGRIRRLGATFGWTRIWRTWVGYEWGRLCTQGPRLQDRLRYLAWRPVLLARRLRW